jgi:hypothetical protein
MSGQTTHTLKSLFTADVSRPIAEDGAFSSVLEGLKATGAIPAAAAEGLGGAFASAIEEMLSPELGEVLASSWSRVAALADALERTRTGDVVMFVPLATHKVTSKHLPTVDLVCAGKAVASLPFDIALSLDLQGLELEVRRGAIAGVRSGKASGQAALGLSGKTFLQKSTPSLDLPGRLAFGASAR